MATPHVTGVFALMLSDSKNDVNKDGIVTTTEVKSKMPTYTEDIGANGYDILYGNGILKAN